MQVSTVLIHLRKGEGFEKRVDRISDGQTMKNGAGGENHETHELHEPGNSPRRGGDGRMAGGREAKSRNPARMEE